VGGTLTGVMTLPANLNPWTQVCDDPNQSFGQDKLQQRYDDAQLMVFLPYVWPFSAHR
jgi:hypothetical protein